MIAAGYLAFLFYQQGDMEHAVIALAVAGAVGGFLRHNFYPASVFMGTQASSTACSRAESFPRPGAARQPAE